jgi:methylenetetrahydrofolate/methylenetetrahydromethanopterin dehydrogenase (NADP+)
MKKLLFQLDTDPLPSVFDTVVAYDGGADRVIGYGGVTPETVGALVEGTIFTRAPKDKKYTAIFVGGSNLADGQALVEATQKKFFADFRVSVMLDSNGSNTTAAAAVANLTKHGSVAGKKAVVLGGTGPVGQRAAVMLTQEGAEVVLTSRRMERAEAACRLMQERFGVTIIPAVCVFDQPEICEASIRDVLTGAHIVLSTAAAGAHLLEERHWKDSPSIEMMLDANAVPPPGVSGIEMMDRAKERHGKLCFGAIGFGALKIALHRACITRLFERNDQRFDAEEIYALAKSLA